MTDYQKTQVKIARSCRDEELRKCASAVLAGNIVRAECAARMAALHEAAMVRIVSDAHCGDCGAHESEACSPTCGFDGPTPSDAMADAGATQ